MTTNRYALFAKLAMLASFLAIMGTPLVHAQFVDAQDCATAGSGFLGCNPSFVQTTAGIQANNQVAAVGLSNLGLTLIELFAGIIVVAIVIALGGRIGLWKFLFGI